MQPFWLWHAALHTVMWIILRDLHLKIRQLLSSLPFSARAVVANLGLSRQAFNGWPLKHTAILLFCSCVGYHHLVFFALDCTLTYSEYNNASQENLERSCLKCLFRLARPDTEQDQKTVWKKGCKILLSLTLGTLSAFIHSVMLTPLWNLQKVDYTGSAGLCHCWLSYLWLTLPLESKHRLLCLEHTAFWNVKRF